MVHAEALSGSRHSAQCHAAGLCGFPGLRGLKATVAVAAGLGVGLTKILQQGLAPTAGDLAQPQHGV